MGTYGLHQQHIGKPGTDDLTARAIAPELVVHQAEIDRDDARMPRKIGKIAQGSAAHAQVNSITFRFRSKTIEEHRER
jgi:hypothetical protein